MPAPETAGRSRAVALTTADGVSLAASYWPAEGRPAVVVAHGFTGHSRNRWIISICARLADAGFTVVAPDLRGHGRSGGRCTAGVQELLDVEAAVAFARSAGAPAVATLGWSMGGTAVLRQAGLGSGADCVVSVSAPGVWWERGTRAMRLVHWMFESRLGRLGTRLLKDTRVASEGWAIEPEPPVSVVARITNVPLLLIHGDADNYFPVSHVRALAGAAPQAEVWVERGMGHAENAAGDQLLDRIAGWIAASLPNGGHGSRPVEHAGTRLPPWQA